MLNIREYKGEIYKIPKSNITRDDYIRIEWSTGFLDMKMYHWDKLSERRKSIILNLK